MTLSRRLAVIASASWLFGCATLDQPTQNNLAQYCSAENAYRLGSQSRAYLGVCPKESETQFLQGLARGRVVRPWAPAVEPYYQQIGQTEQQLLSASTEPERERLRARLRDLEWWAIHLINNKSSFHD